jgi:cytochrome c oxidase subunit 3
VSAILLFLAAVAAVAGWWLSRQRLLSKPWLEVGLAGEFPGTAASATPPAKLGLWVFMAVAAALLTLFASAYLMRMHMSADWRSVPLPRVLWLNTAVLALSSLALHRAQMAARIGWTEGVRVGLLAGGLAALAFLAGAGGLGDAIFSDVNFRSNVLVAGGLCVVLAVVLDLLVLLAQRALTPWTRAAAQ